MESDNPHRDALLMLAEEVSLNMIALKERAARAKRKRQRDTLLYAEQVLSAMHMRAAELIAHAEGAGG